MKNTMNQLLEVCEYAFQEACRENKNQKLIDALDTAITQAKPLLCGPSKTENDKNEKV